MKDHKGKKSAFIVNIDSDEAVKKLIDGAPNFTKFESGYEVGGEWRHKLLDEYHDTMEENNPGGWEYPGIYIPGNPKVPKFAIDAWQPEFVLGRWYGDADDIPHKGGNQ